MNKIWQVAPRAREEFFKKYPEHDRVILQLLYDRNLRDSDEVELFLNGRYEDNFDPFLFRQMRAAIDLTIARIKEKKRICIYGDYDADGMTASALLFEALSTLQADCFVYIPDRTGEGYGVNRQAVDKIKKKGAALIITVDGGIRNKEEISYAKELGMEVIITDHHAPPEEESDIPDCLIINPHLKGERYPFKFLAGVGVAFKFVRALVEASTLKSEQKEKMLLRALDLVAIGTISDCVTLLGENRLLLKKGLEILNETKRLGLKELIKKANIEGRELEAWNVGFQIGPRLNASSRMGSAGNAYNLLITKDKKEAEKEAECLNERNLRRQKETEEVFIEAEEQIKNQLSEKIIIAICPDRPKAWNEGIIGLVAGKITEKYYKPSLIITKAEKDFKGSGRSIKDFNLFKAIEECTDVLLKHGGHPMACGFNLTADNLEKFSKKIQQIAKRELADKDLEAKLRIDCELDIKDVNRELLREVKKLRPFGQHNPEPKFLSENVQIRDIVKMGASSQHIKFRFNNFWGVAFNRAEEWKDLKIGDFLDIVYLIEENEFNGNTALQIKLIDARPHGAVKIHRGQWEPDLVYID